MSIELYEARRKLDIFEKGINNPEIFMSASFADIFDNLLRGITLNQKGVFDYVEDYLNQLDIFRETKIDISLECITVSLPSIDEDNSYDRIIWISFENHTYKVLNKSIKQYREVMNRTYTYEPQEIRDIFKRYENYSLMKRITVARRCLVCKNKTPWIRMQDFLFSLFVSKRYLKKILDREHIKICEKNEFLKEKYDKDIRKQNFYLQKAPNQILKIEQKQKEIVNYLSRYGFTEYNDADWIRC